MVLLLKRQYSAYSRLMRYTIVNLRVILIVSCFRIFLQNIRLFYPELFLSMVSNNTGVTSIYRAAPSLVSYTELKQEEVGDILSELIIDRSVVRMMDVILEGGTI